MHSSICYPKDIDFQVIVWQNIKPMEKNEINNENFVSFISVGFICWTEETFL